MNELKITDVVDQKAFEQLERLKSELDSTFAAYKKAGDAMAEGLKIKPGPYSELISKAKDYYAVIEKVYALEDKIKRIQEEQKNVLLHLNAEVQKRVKAILDEAAANDNLKKAITATNTTRQQSSSLISKEASEIEKSNIAKREAYQVDQESLKIADSILGTRQQNIVRLNQLNKELKAVVASQKDLEEKEKKGLITSSEAGKQRLELVSHERELKQSKQELNRILVNEEKTIQSSEGSYQQLSLQLERMKIAYKQMNDEEAKSTGGTKLATEIQQLDTYLKEASSSMGEHQRKVGQYENAAKGLRSEYRSMIEEIALLTLQYRALTAEEQKSASGKELQQKIDEMIQKASTLKDAMADVQDSVSKGASDTFTFDAISQGIDAIVSSMGAATGATHLLGMSDKELEEIQTDLQAAFVISNSIIRIQTALQKQSSLMKGVAAIQEAALVKATNLNTAAQGKNIIVTKAATVAQAAFNLVAKANPYVLLAMALVTVVGALALYAKGTADASENQKRLNEYEKEYREYLEYKSRTLIQVNDENIKGLQRELEIAKSRKASLSETRTLEDEIYKERLIRNNKLLGFYSEEVHNIDQNKDKLEQYKDQLNRVYQAIRDEHKEVSIDLNLNGKISKKKVQDAKELLQQKINETEEKIQIGVELVTENKDLKSEQERIRNQRIEENRQIADKEKSLIRKAEDEKVQLIGDGFTRQRLQTAASFQRRIEDLKQQLKTESNLTVKGKQAINDQIKALEQQQAKNLEDINRKQQQAELEEYRRTQDVAISIQEEGVEKKKKIAWVEYERQVKDLQDQIMNDDTLTPKQIKYLYDRIKLLGEQYQKEKAQIIIDENNRLAEAEISNLSTSALNEQNILDKKYKEGKISRENYEKESLAITAKYSKEAIRLQIAQAEAELAELDVNSERAKELQDAIDNLKTQLDNLNIGTFDEKDKAIAEFTNALQNMQSVAQDSLGDTADIFSAFTDIINKFTESGVSNFGKFWEELDPTEKASMILQATAQLMNGITSIMTSAFDVRIEQIEEQQEKNEEAGEEEKERIEDLVNSGVITKEEGESRKRAAEVRTKQKHDELEKQKADLEQKQAKWQKANSIIQTTIATSQAIMKALAEAGPFAGPILAAVIGAMGAAQVAIIASQPIPKYAKGTDNHPGGLAIVGDGGRQEVIETDNGAYITPSVPTLVDIPKRAKVIPNLVDYRKMSLHSDALMLDRQMRSGDNGEPIIVNVNNNVGRLEQKFEDITGETKKIVRYLKKRTNLSDWKRSERNI